MAGAAAQGGCHHFFTVAPPRGSRDVLCRPAPFRADGPGERARSRIFGEETHTSQLELPDHHGSGENGEVDRLGHQRVASCRDVVGLGRSGRHLEECPARRRAMRRRKADGRTRRTTGGRWLPETCARNRQDTWSLE